MLEANQDGTGNVPQLSQALVKSLNNESLAEAGATAADIGLDAVIDSGALDGVPVFGALLSFRKAGLAIRDALFERKVAKFLSGFADADPDERSKFVEKLRAEGKLEKFGETVLLLLDRLDDMTKPEMGGLVMAAAAAGKIELSEALRVSRIIDRAFIDDLRFLPSMTDGVVHRDETVPNALFSAGLLDNVGLDAGGYDQEEKPGGTLYARNKLAKIIIEHALNRR